MLYLSVILNLTLLATIQTWWFAVIMLVVTAAVLYLLFNKKNKKLEHENGKLQQQVVEYKELLENTKYSEQKAKEETQHLNTSKSLLMAKLSHEIRTPMNGVIGMASLLTETELTGEQKEYTEVIIKSSESLMTTINDMLVSDVISYSEIGYDAMELEYKDFDLRNMLEDVMESFALKAAQQQVELIYSIENEVPELIVNDAARLRQVLMNLTENALRFTINGEIFITICLARALKGNQVQLLFEIKDNGRAMPAEEMEIISKNLTDINIYKEGDAIGLIISKKLVNLMGGRLEMEINDAEFKGNTIKFKILTRVSLQPARPNVNFDAALKNGKVLLVDDNFSSKNVLKKQLEQLSLVTTTAASAKEAFDILNKDQHFDIIITDLDMPGTDGIEFTRLLKDRNIQTPVILLNTMGDEHYKTKQGLFTAILNKPVKQQLLHKYLSRELSKPDVFEPIQNTKPNLPSYMSKNYPMEILVVEDNKTNQMVALKILSKLGYKASLANDGEEALEMISDGRYDLIFMDIQMPVKDGLETTRIIRLCLNVQPVIIAMTANAIAGDKQKCLQAGMDDYISKPFRIEELIKMIEKWSVQLKVKS